MSRYRFTVGQGRRIDDAVRWWEAHGRNSVGNRRDYPSRRTATGGGDGSDSVTFQITGNETVNAMYTAKTYTDSSGGTISLTSGTLTTSSFGTLAGSNNAIVLVTNEALGYSATGHDVTSTNNGFSTVGTGRIVDTRSDGAFIIHATIPYTSCTS